MSTATLAELGPWHRRIFHTIFCASVIISITMPHISGQAMHTGEEAHGQNQGELIFAAMLKAAREGDPDAQFRVAQLKLSADPKVENFEDTALVLLLKSAQAGYVPSMLLLGRGYRDGTFLAKDHRQALDWDEKAAALGSIEGYHGITSMYIEGGGNVPANPAKAVESLKSAANLGDPYSISFLGMAYVRGALGVPVDKTKGVELLTEASQKGSVDAMITLAIEYESGKNIERDLPRSLSMCDKAIAAGGSYYHDHLELYTRAVVCLESPALCKGPQETKDFLIRAGDAGNPFAYSLLTKKIIDGTLPGTKEEAFAWAHKSAMLGQPSGEDWVSKLYYDGTGVEKSISRAKFWATQAKITRLRSEQEEKK